MIRSKIQCIYGLADVADFTHAYDTKHVRSKLSVESNERVVATVARLSPEKGLDTLIQAIAKTEYQYPLVRYFLVGEGPERVHLIDQIKASGLQDTVQLLGFRDDVPALIAGSDIFVLPSLDEGGPWAVVEAMAAGKAVIASDVGFVKEISGNGRSVRVIKPGDVTELTRALNELLSLDDLALAKMGSEAREQVLKVLSEDQWFERIQTLYQ